MSSKRGVFTLKQDRFINGKKFACTQKYRFLCLPDNQIINKMK